MTGRSGMMYGRRHAVCMARRRSDVWAKETPHPLRERMDLSSRRDAGATPYCLYGETPQRRMGERDAVHTPVRSKGGVYSSLAAVRSWVKPSVMPQLCM